MSHLHISEAEWIRAEQFYKNPVNNNKKLRRQDDPLYYKANTSIHSFIKVNNEIYALAANSYLGEGTFGKVKVGQTKTGDNVAVKIEGGALRDESDVVIKVMRMIGYYIGQYMRPLNKEIIYKDVLTTSKLYTVTKLRQGQELYNNLAFNNYSETQKLIIAIKCCLTIRKLHHKQIVHADIKPENFMIIANGHNINIKTIDFDFAKIIAKRSSYFTDEKAMGTPVYIAPEILYKSRYSFASDIYALGILFKDDLGFDTLLSRAMRAYVPSQRPSMREILNMLNKELQKQSDLDVDSLALIQKLNRLLTPKPEPMLAQYYLTNAAQQKNLINSKHLANIEPNIFPVEEGKVQDIVLKINKLALN